MSYVYNDLEVLEAARRTVSYMKYMKLAEEIYDSFGYR